MIFRARDYVIDLAEPKLMGILNVTPDSFSGDGLFGAAGVAQCVAMAHDGATIIDVGGVSTRPGATAVSTAEEHARITPVLYALQEQSHVPLSIDTTNPLIAREALNLGASIINDVSGLANPAMMRAVRDHAAGIVIMHGRRTHIRSNIVDEVTTYLERKYVYATANGVNAECIVLDPGIGFGKTFEQNLSLLRQLNVLADRLPRPLLVGASRKGFLSMITGKAEPQQRDTATAAVTVQAVQAGVSIVRVHNVSANRDALYVALALNPI